MSTSPISTESLADLYFQLSRLEQAGFPAQQAFGLLEKTDPETERLIDRMQRQLKSGRSIAESGYRTGLFSGSDRAVIHAGEISGNLAVIYRQLADYYGDRVRRARKIKAQLVLPSVVLALALFIQPLPALILNQIGGMDYLAATVGRLFTIALLLFIVVKLPGWLTDGWLRRLGLSTLVYQLQFRLPVIAPWLISRQINGFFRSLGLMLNAGIAVSEALPKALETFSNPLLRAQFDPVISATANGSSLTEALSEVGEVDRQTIQLLLAGEKSGKLAETVLQVTKLEAEKIDRQNDSLAEWLPRIFYLYGCYLDGRFDHCR